MGKYQDLIMFQKADELAIQIYKLTSDFPKDETYGLTSQIRRAALSVPTNIVEGHSRKSKKEFKQFLNIALGPHAETEYLFGFAKRMGLLKTDHSHTEALISEVGKILWGFYKTL